MSLQGATAARLLSPETSNIAGLKSLAGVVLKSLRQLKRKRLNHTVRTWIIRRGSRHLNTHDKACCLLLRAVLMKFGTSLKCSLRKAKSGRLIIVALVTWSALLLLLQKTGFTRYIDDIGRRSVFNVSPDEFGMLAEAAQNASISDGEIEEAIVKLAEGNYRTNLEIEKLAEMIATQS